MTRPKSRSASSVLMIKYDRNDPRQHLGRLVVSCLAFTPVVVPSKRPTADQPPLSGPHFRISPIPPGADYWIS